MNKILIRKAVRSDIDDILNLENQYPEDIYSKDTILSTFNYDYYYTYVAVYDDKVIGYISATIIFDECNLLKIIVDKNYRKNGIGKMLINFLFDLCIKLSSQKIFLEVRQDNDTAISFYKKMGFQRESVRKGYYAGVDAEIFWYYINDKKSKL